ncbi:endoglucanase 14-like [Lolium perenne]|uniref:endoglucanase 14-like n=1 Tax=Lolium perenne TaxID=4522 RepID=UPI0021F52657|nr:endoglucanase 14-like [Lolium perenne]
MVSRRALLVVAMAGVLAVMPGCAPAQHDYAAALSKSLLYFEAQRSGRLPPTQRVRWRGHSALNDGADHGVDLTGGYYDSGDNVKFGFPMAFTVTMLSWVVVEHGARLAAAGELGHTLEAVRWGADYLARAHAAPDTLYVQVGDGDSDHKCWERPEDMDTPRNSYMVNPSNPGSDVAAETAAALAAAAVVFSTPAPGGDRQYASTLLTHAKQLFEFAKNHRGLYQNSVPSVRSFYSSSGDEDELLWAAVWLYIATGDQEYKGYIAGANNLGWVPQSLGWDNKFIGAQALVAKLILQGKLPNDGHHGEMKSSVEKFLCNVVQHGDGSSGRLTPGGMLYVQQWENTQALTSAMFVLVTYADYLAAARASLQCGGVSLAPAQLVSFARAQVDYLLGKNPMRMSYMVGFGNRYPQQPHHRGASLPSIKSNPGKITCNEGSSYFQRPGPNSNVIDGAIVGGPDANDHYNDTRGNYVQGEPSTYGVAPIIGVLARLLHR